MSKIPERRIRVAYLYGVTQREFMSDRPAYGTGFNRVLALLGDVELRENHYAHFEDASKASVLGSGDDGSFVKREGIVSSDVLFAFPQESSPTVMCNALLFMLANASKV